MGEDTDETSVITPELIDAVLTDKRPNRSRGPGKGKRAESVHLLAIAIQALQTAREAALKVRQDMPRHERDRLLIAPLSDAGLAVRSVQEAVERWERGGV